MTRFPALRRFARAPGWYSIRLLLVLQRVAARPASRQLLWEYATNRRLRSSAPVDRLVEDLLKVDLLRAAWAHPNGFFVERHGGTYVSRTAATAPAAGDDQMSTGLVWDHTAIGNSISVPVAFGRRATVYLATDGRYAFSALAAIASAAPDSVAPLFPETEDDAEQQVTVPALEPVAR